MLNTLFLQASKVSKPELFGIEIFNDDFYKLVVLFGLNLLPIQWKEKTILVCSSIDCLCSIFPLFCS